MGFLESLRDKELRGLYRAQKLIENADLHLANGRAKEASDALSKAEQILLTDGLQKSPHAGDFADALVNLSRVLSKAKEHDRAVKAADRSLKLEPGSLVAMLARADALAKKDPSKRPSRHWIMHWNLSRQTRAFTWRRVTYCSLLVTDKGPFRSSRR